MEEFVIQNSQTYPPISDISTTEKVKVGTIVGAISQTYGGGEFIYLKGVAST